MKKGTKLSIENIMAYISEIKEMDIETAKQCRLIKPSLTQQEWVNERNLLIMGTSKLSKLIDNIQEINEKGLLTPKARKLSPDLQYLVGYVEKILDVLPISKTLITDIELKKLSDVETRFLVSIERFGIVGNISHTFKLDYRDVFELILTKMVEFKPDTESGDVKDRNLVKISSIPLTKTSTIVRWITLFSEAYYTYAISDKGFKSATKFKTQLELAIEEGRFEVFFENIHSKVKSEKLTRAIIAKSDAERPSPQEVVQKLRQGKRGSKSKEKAEKAEKPEKKTAQTLTYNSFGGLI